MLVNKLISVKYLTLRQVSVKGITVGACHIPKRTPETKTLVLLAINAPMLMLVDPHKHCNHEVRAPTLSDRRRLLQILPTVASYRFRKLRGRPGRSHSVETSRPDMERVI